MKKKDIPLNEAELLSIKRLYAKGVSLVEISERIGVSVKQILSIVKINPLSK